MVVQPELEAGLEITRQALLHLNIPTTEIQRYTDTVRQESYAPIYQSREDYRKMAMLANARNLLELTWAKVVPGSPIENRSIGELAIREQTGASVVGVIRQGKFYPAPGTDYRFDTGDLVAVIGEAQERDAFERLAIAG